MKAYIFAVATLCMGLAAACTDETPTGTGEGVIPGSPRSVEVFLPFEEVTTGLQQIRGYGSVATLGEAWLAREYEGEFDSHVLVRFNPPPATIQAADPFGTTRTDSMFTVIGGEITIRIDTLGVGGNVFNFQARTPTVPWDVGSATWTMALDTAGRQVSWPEPGGAGGEVVGSADWLHEESDSVIIELDSAAVAAWSDEKNETRGVQIELANPGNRFRITNVRARVRIRPSFNEEGEVVAELGSGIYTFIYSPETAAGPSDILFGGAPSWRSVFEFTLPETLNGPTAVCETFGCPVALTSEMVSAASLVLTSSATPEDYRTADTLELHVRPVLQPELLPKSPLGSAVLRTRGSSVSAPAFTGLGGIRVEVPLTGYIQSLIEGVDQRGNAPSSTVALHARFEPSSLTYVGFHGPGSAAPPRLRLILSTAEPVELP